MSKDLRTGLTAYGDEKLSLFLHNAFGDSAPVDSRARHFKYFLHRSNMMKSAPLTRRASD
ncbi:MAG: hypothetical protein J0H82_18205 [Alphaproteobacteria bacterium]|nr:hypothetical protein [Alphaproteobacteria bacterium]